MAIHPFLRECERYVKWQLPLGAGVPMGMRYSVSKRKRALKV